MPATVLRRREFLASSLAAVTAVAGAPRAVAHPNSDIRYSVSGQMWNGDRGYNNIEEGVKEAARMGLDGIEPFRQHIMKYLNDPLAFKRQLDAAGIAMSSCSDGGQGMSSNFIDPTRTAQTVSDHVTFAKNFLTVFGCTAFKFNLGQRPADGVVTDDHLKIVADTLNKIGQQTIAFGVRAAAHPHLWGPMEREHEVRRVLELTDPKYVWLTTDTGHLTLCGMDPLAIMTEYYPRIAEVHYKDCDPKYRGNKVSPTQAQHRETDLYLNMGAGGVDFPAIHRMLLAHQYKGWISLDFDAPRPGEGMLEENLYSNRKYLTDVLHVNTLGPARLGQSACLTQCQAPAAP